MKTRLCTRCLILFLVFALAWTVGCSRKPKPATTPPVSTTQTTPAPKPPEPPPPTPPAPAPAKVELTDVYFDYDKYVLREDTRLTLGEDGKILSGSTSNLVLEGHCDERGTVEYNLALGQKRADAVKAYLVEYGLDGARLSTISYGEERPFAQGHDETAWAQNRRVHFVVR